MMTAKTFPPDKNRRDIGEVVLPIEKMSRARELSSSCIGVEAMLERDRGPDGFLTKAAGRAVTRKKDRG